jgi:hypothetical protein
MLWNASGVYCLRVKQYALTMDLSTFFVARLSGDSWLNLRKLQMLQNAGNSLEFPSKQPQ